MKLVRLSAIPVLCGRLVGASSTLATTTYSKIASMPVPGLRSFDISHTPITRFGGFVGFTGNNDTSGPNGVVVVHPEHEVWAGAPDRQLTCRY
jgi:hypothetical protein